MEVQKYRNSDIIQANLLHVGDVFRTDDSYTITGIAKNDTLLKVNQSIFTDRETSQRRINFGSSVCNSVHYSNRDCTLDEILRVKGISLKDKFFVVVETNMQGGGPAPHGEPVPFSDGHHIKAIESDGFGNPNEKDGLSLEFYQTGSFNCMVPYPYYVGHNKRVAEETKPKALKAG